MTHMYVKSVRWGDNNDFSHHYLLYGQVILDDLLKTIRKKEGILLATGATQAVFVGPEVTNSGLMTIELAEPKTDAPTR